MTAGSPFLETTGSARHAALAELAAGGPARRVELFTGVTVWLVTGYEEARALLADPRVARSPDEVPHRDALPEPVRAAMNSHVLAANPPDHTRLRRLVTAAFTRRRVESLAPRIGEIAESLADDMASAGAGGAAVDVVGGFAYPLPITVIAELVGVPEPDRAAFRRWSTVVSNGPVYPADEFVAAATEMIDYLRVLIGRRRAEPADDLLTALIRVRDGDQDGDRLSDDELTSTVFLLLAAGHETTANLIATGLHALLTHPDQLRLLRAEPDRLPDAIEELLRFDSPAQVTIPAVTTGPVPVGDVTLPAGEVVLAVLIAANRDPRRFPDPDRLDLDRARQAGATHLAFGHGIHHCLGAPLARLEARIAFRVLLDRLPALRLADPGTEPARPPALLLNGLRELPVRVD